MAVNSGNPADSVSSYLSSVGCPWPAIVDEDRSFEAACGVGEISLENIWQTRVLTPEGTLGDGRFERLEAHLETARWNVDPSGIPPSLRPAWRALEFEQHPDAIAVLAALAGTSEDEQRASARLRAVLSERLDAEIAAARALAAEPRPWDASERYQRILDSYAGFDSARTTAVEAALEELLPQLVRATWQGLERARPGAYSRLNELLAEELALRTAAADALARRGEPWEAAKAYQSLLDDFAGFDRARLAPAADALRELQKDERVKAESLAMKALERAREKLATNAADKAEPARSELRRLVEKHSGTEAARLAQELLRSLEASAPTRKP